MLEFFRTNQFAANLLLIFYVSLLRASTFIFPQEWSPKGEGVLSEFVYYYTGTSGYMPDLVALIFVFIQAFMINELVARYRMANENTLFPGLFYVLLMSCIPDFLHLSPPLLANTFYILALFELFGIYKKNNVAARLFNLGLWIAIASLFYFSFTVFILLAIIGIGLLRAFRLREWLMSLIGFLVAYYLVGIYYYWYDLFAVFVQKHIFANMSLINLEGPQTIDTYIKLGFMGLMIVIAVFSFNLYNQKKNIQVQKYLSILYWAMFVTIFSLLLQEVIGIEHLIILVVPLSIFIASNFLSFAKKQTAEAIHLFLIFMILAFQFKGLFV